MWNNSNHLTSLHFYQCISKKHYWKRSWVFEIFPNRWWVQTFPIRRCVSLSKYLDVYLYLDSWTVTWILQKLRQLQINFGRFSVSNNLLIISIATSRLRRYFIWPNFNNSFQQRLKSTSRLLNSSNNDNAIGKCLYMCNRVFKLN